MKLRCFVLTALTLSLTVPALADTLVTTPTISGSLANGGTLSGTATVDTNFVPNQNTTMNQGLFTGMEFTVEVNNTLFTFNSIHYQGVQSGEYYFDSYDAANDLLMIGFPLADLSSIETEGFNGYCVISSSCNYTSSFMPEGGADVRFASLVNAPEPSSLLLLASGTLGLLGAARRRLARA